MHCAGCELAIENGVKQLPGIHLVKADYEHDYVEIRYDGSLTSLETIVSEIKREGYYPEIASAFHAADPVTGKDIGQDSKKTRFKALKNLTSVALAFVGIGLILWLDTWFMNHADMPKLGRDISYGLLFVIGFLTSFHCVGMCGPFILGYCAKNVQSGQISHFPHVLYGIGKTVSYTLIGALFGAFGAIIAFTPHAQGMVGIAAGLFLVLYGLHMLEAFAFLKHFQIRMPAFWTRLVGEEYRKHSNPFVIGLLNGLMIICGPLQAMYVMAAGTGNWFDGGSILLFFGLGTLPLLMGFGVMTSLLSANLTPKLLKASGYIVMALGAVMLNRGLTVTGSGADFNTLTAKLSQQLAPESVTNALNANEQIIVMDVLQRGYSPNKFTLRKGVPVKWLINGKELNECNKSIIVPQYNLKIDIHEGEQTVLFTPQETGIVPWSCWMGMIPGSFIVVEDSPQKSASGLNPTQSENNAESPADTPAWFEQINEKIQPWFNRLTAR